MKSEKLNEIIYKMYDVDKDGKITASDIEELSESKDLESNFATINEFKRFSKTLCLMW
jgi:hypothetical protein